MSDTFWAVIADQLKELKSAKTADDVVRILSKERNPYGYDCAAGDAHGFFTGSGGDGSVSGSLTTAGWSQVWAEAAYYYVMRAPDGSEITYIEGDIYLGARR